jgi:drug/metabolite transporter (DMT)-like permease
LLLGGISVDVKENKAANSAGRQKAGLATYLCLCWFLAFRAFGNLSLAWGTRHISEGLAMNPFAYFRAMLNPFIAVGILLLIGGMLSRMALLSLADLSFVLPMTSVGYVISVVFGRVFLHEAVSPERWLGVLLIFLAALLVGSTSHKTTDAPS